MKRIAFFVEGQTEQILIERLLLEVAGRSNVQITLQKAFGGASGPRRIVQVGGTLPGPTVAPFHATIVDSSNDSRVASDIRDHYESLVNSGVTKIVGLRDVRPDFTRADIPRLLRMMGYGVRTVPVSPDYVLAVMEVEAWFLAEHSHFSRLAPPVDLAVIPHAPGFDPRVDDMTLVDEPAKLLARIYSSAGFSYNKSKAVVSNIVDAVDYATLYLETVNRDSALAKLVGILNAFFEPESATS